MAILTLATARTTPSTVTVYSLNKLKEENWVVAKLSKYLVCRVAFRHPS